MTENELLDIADRAAALMADKGTAGFDIYARSSSTSSVEVKSQELDAYEEAVTWGVGVRVMLPGGRVGFAYSSGRDDAAEAAVSAAAANAASAEPDEHNGFPAPPDLAYPAAALHDPRVVEISEADKIARAMSLEKAALDYDPRVKRVRKASVSFTESRLAIVNSQGVRAAASGTHLSCGIMVVAEDGSGSQMGYDFDYRRRDGEIDYEGVGVGASARAVGLLGARKAPSGLFPVLLENTVSSDFLGVLSASFSGESVIKGKSMLADRTGRKVLSELIDILDDGLLPGGGGTRPFDDEGVPSRTTPLVTGGVLQGFLHNTYTARRSGLVSTGNASRGGFRAQPGVGSTNLYIAKGAASLEELVSGVSGGLFVRDVLGMHTANPITGDFSVGVSGHWIQGGKIAYPVKEAAISGNILEMLTNVEAVGSDLRFRGRIGAPGILLRPISVSGG